MAMRMRYDCSFQNSNTSEVAWENYQGLKKAIRCKDINQVKNLVASGVQVNGKNKNRGELTPLQLAVISRSVEIVEILLKNGANVNDYDINWDTPITLAAKVGDSAIVDLLLSHNVQHHSSSRDNLNHLHIACMRNNLGVVKKLVLGDNGQTINSHVVERSPFWPGFTPLHFAVYYGSIETVEYLLKCGANILAEDSKELTPLHWADLRRNEVIIDLLLAAHKYEFKNPEGSRGLTHFHIACTRDDDSVVEHFLKLGLDIDHIVKSYDCGYWLCWKPIQLAMYYECPKVVELLLKCKADYKIDTRLAWLYDFLECAFVNRNHIIYNSFTKTLMESKQNWREVEKLSDFHQACISNNTEAMDVCLMKDPSALTVIIDAPIWNGYTALHLAAKHNSLNATKMLLTNGADIMAQDFQGKTPLHIAFDLNYSKIVKTMVKNLPPVHENVTDDAGLSLLHILCSTDQLEVIKNLVRSGVDVNMRVRKDSACWANSTPMDFACKFKQRHIIEFLLEHKADIYIKNESISDHFALVFEEYFEQTFLTGLQKLLYRNLMSIFSSPSTQMKYSNDCRISPLHVLCMYDARSTLEKYLISHKNEINQAIEMPHSRKYHKCTPLHLALRFHHYECAKLMLDAGADLLVLNDVGETPLESTQYMFDGFRICHGQYSNLFSVKALPLASLKPSHFAIACCMGATQFVEHVLNNVDDQKLKDKYVNCLNDVKQTPLHSLASFRCLSESDSSKRKQIMELLLKNGANVSAKDYMFSTPLHHAEREEVVRLLIDYGADVNAQNIEGLTPLHAICARSKNHVRDIQEAIITFLDSGADIEIEDGHSRTCLMVLADFEGAWAKPGESTIPLLKHFKKLDLIGFNSHEGNDDAYEELFKLCQEDFDEDAFENECERELEKMKLKHIDRYTTLYDILFKSSNEMTSHCENDTLQSIFRSNDFPIYGFLIRLQMKKGEMRKPLIESAQISLNSLFDTSLPKVCLELILNYLSDNDLKNVTASVSSFAEVL